MRSIEVKGRITTQDQATAAVDEICDKVVILRDQIDQMGARGDSTNTKDYQSAYKYMLIHFGSAVGTLTSLHRANLISDNAFQILNAKVMATLVPKVVGIVENPVQPPGGMRVQ